MRDISSGFVSESISQYVESTNDLNFIYNSPENEQKVITTVSKNLKSCDSFDFSVAFISMSGVTVLLQELRRFNTGNKRGRILTTDYLNFNDPEALRKLLNFDDIDVRVYTKENFHTKAYMFNKDGKTTALVGSSNLTAGALCQNKEWNLLVSYNEVSLLGEIQNEFESMWRESEYLTEEWIIDYIPRFEKSKRYHDEEKKELDLSKVPKPNSIQKDALKELQDLRDSGKDRALIISATGTGKTYLSAFDVANFKPKRLLFLVHRDKILNDAMDSYKKVLGSDIKAGKLTGECKDFDSDFLFSTTQSMSSECERFNKDHFDYIVCDEAHRSAASQYERIIKYFEPKFLLGMTATPERTDGNEILDMFENIAYEIRLKGAMSLGMVSPFHYFGISDITVEGELLDEDADFSMLTSDERADHILNEAKYYGYSGSRLRGLIFCSLIDECKVLSEKLNERGLRTVALTGNSSNEEREDAINRLEGDYEGGIDYILTRDIFNEGIDIPGVNQVILLRPTKSAIIFVQQLGRGLRRRDDLKEYLVVLDFIGNYKNNFMISVALSEDKSGIKDNLRRFMLKGNALIPGTSTVSFDEITKEKIFESISSSNLSNMANIRNTYSELVERYDRLFTLSELYDVKELDPIAVVNAFDNLNHLQTKLKNNNVDRLDDDEYGALKTITKTFSTGLRAQELVILRELLEFNSVEKRQIINILEEEFNIDITDKDSLNSAISVLDSTYAKGERFIDVIGDILVRSEYFNKLLKSHRFKYYVEDAVNCGLKIYSGEYKDQVEDGFKVYGRYKRADVMRLLNWEQEPIFQFVGGYAMNDKSMPIFVTYIKGKEISSIVKYEDKFIDKSTMQWMSKHTRTTKSVEIQNIMNSKDKGISNYLFVKRSEHDDGIQFYYLGKAHVVDAVDDTDIDEKGKKRNIVRFKLKLEKSVRDDIFEYITM